MINKILEAREERYNNIIKYNNITIIIKANTPGENKNLWFSKLLVNIFTNLLINKYHTSYKYFESFDGNYTLINIADNDYKTYKLALVEIEETHPLGRFIDLDLYYNKKPVSRSLLNLNHRKCYLCNKPAHFCTRNQTHKLSDLLNKQENEALNYLNNYITSTLKTSMIKELDLDYKFGLVEKTNKHSHHDMDYDLMMKSINHLFPLFKDFITLGFKDLAYDEYFNKAREIGLNIEKLMFINTNKINTYKGLIFIMALLITSISITIHNKKSFDNIFLITKLSSRDIYDDFKINDYTFGKYAYEKYNIKGIRKEAYLGFPTIQEMLSYYNDINNNNILRELLIDIIIKAEDTTLLKRAKSLENYNSIKLKFQKLNKANSEDIKLLHHEMVNNNISFGGAADLLIGTIFLNEIKNHLFLVK